MAVIGHEHECIGLDDWEFPSQLQSPFCCRSTRIIQMHFVVDNLAEQARSALGHDRYEVRAWRRVIESLQSTGATPPRSVSAHDLLPYKNTLIFFADKTA